MFLTFLNVMFLYFHEQTMPIYTKPFLTDFAKIEGLPFEKIIFQRWEFKESGGSTDSRLLYMLIIYYALNFLWHFQMEVFKCETSTSIIWKNDVSFSFSLRLCFDSNWLFKLITLIDFIGKLVKTMIYIYKRRTLIERGAIPFFINHIEIILKNH